MGGPGTTECSHCHCLEQFTHKPFHPPVTVTAAGPGHHSSALNVLLKAQSHLPDTRCPWAASLRGWGSGPGLCSLCSSPGHLLLAPSFFWNIILPTGLTLYEFSLSAVSPSLFQHSLDVSSSWELMTSVETVPKCSEADGSRLLLTIQKPFPSFPGSRSRFSFPSLRALSQGCSADTGRSFWSSWSSVPHSVCRETSEYLVSAPERGRKV